MVMPGTDATGQQGTYYFSAPPGQGVPVPMQQYTAPQQYSQQMPRGGPSTGMQQSNMQPQDMQLQTMQPPIMQAQRGGQVHSRGGGPAPTLQQGFTSLPTGAMPFMPSGSAQQQQPVQQQQDAHQTAKQPPRRYTQMTFANPNQQQNASLQGGAQSAPSK